MKKSFLLKLRKKAEARLLALRSKLEGVDELREEELATIQEEVTELTEEIRELDESIENADDNEENPDGSDPKDDDDENPGSSGDASNPEQRSATPESRQAAMTAITNALSTRNAKSTKKKDAELRSAFAKFVVGKITETEARTLGLVTGNGSVVVPTSIVTELVTYAQEENLLRKYGSVHRTKGYESYPVLVRKAEANVSTTERTTDIPESDIELDEILLSPVEFDALATVSKKLVYMSSENIEEIVIEELKKAYVRKETEYMFNGASNNGSLAKKAVGYYESAVVGADDAVLYKELVKLKGQPTTEVVKKAMWILNRAAYTRLEGMTDSTGRPLLYEAADGMGYKLLGHKVDFTDAANATDATKPIFYFGDFKSFHIQEVIGSMELQKLIEQFALKNRIGFKIYQLLDGQLIYSPLEPTVYRYEVGATAPVGG